MFNAGAARMVVEFQDPVETLDSMYAPTRTWAKYMEVHAGVEGEQYNVDDGISTGPREEGVKSMTLVIRNHSGLAFHTRQRVLNKLTNELYEITGIRYDGKRTLCFVDVRGGQASG
jgi:hypothetical protein